MDLNADFDQSVIIRPSENSWTPSPMPGVDRMMLDRIGDEVARATTIVRYAPGSAFSAHTHDGGEEFLVLDGVFSDEHGDFPAGSYIRNPPTSSHTPGSRPGCVIFVKLWQMQPDDRTHLRVATQSQGAVADANRAGVTVQPLYADAFEEVRMENWAPETRLQIPGGAEALIITGAAEMAGAALPAWTWIRRAAQDPLDLITGQDGLRLWVKSGHLPFAKAPHG